MIASNEIYGTGTTGFRVHFSPKRNERKYIVHGFYSIRFYICSLIVVIMSTVLQVGYLFYLNIFSENEYGSNGLVHTGEKTLWQPVLFATNGQRYTDTV